ncbi:MAG TPA: polyprenol monophosphomannose synthase [archaeon]|nr:polyprenol monophosphomannose synthase [archaeon]
MPIRTQPKRKNFVSVILGTYNEKENITRLIPLIESIFRQNEIRGEIVVVDDNSPDGTSNLVRKFGRKYGNVRLLWRPKKMGHASSLIDGYKFARGDVIMTMDVDFSHDATQIPKFLNEIDKGYDLVVGSRFMRDGGYEVKSFQTFKKKTISSLGNMLIRFLSGVPVHDFTNSMRAVRRKVIDNINIESKTNSFFFEFIIKTYRKGFRIKEIPIYFKDRVAGTSKLKLGKQAFKALVDLVKFTVLTR